MRWIAAAASALVLALLLGGIWFYTRPGDQAVDRFASCRTSAIAGGAEQIGGPFTLVNSDGQTVTDKDVITGPTLLYFGYTFCPDVCPLDTVRNADAVDILDAQGKTVTPVFISIDPERDTPEAVGDFAHNVHERMIGLTGSPEQVKAASQAYRTYFKKQPSDDEFYLVDHSTFTYLVLPEYGFVEYFRREMTPEDLAQRAGCFIDRM